MKIMPTCGASVLGMSDGIQVSSGQLHCTDPKLGARTVDEIERYSREKKFNCKAQPLFDFIPIDHVIIDTLHLFLRKSDVLIDLLIRELRSDSIK